MPERPLDLSLERWGDEDATGAPVVVLLHAGVADARAWAPVAERLAQRGAAAVVPDLRGFGRSPDRTSDFRHADDVLALLDAVAPQRPVVLVGWSMSGTVALDVAARAPERIAGLALVCSVPDGLPRSAMVLEAWEREEQLFEAGDVEGAVANDVETWAVGRRRSRADVPAPVIEHVDAVARDLIARDERALGEALDGSGAPLEQLADLTMPLLVVTAEHDTPCHDDALASFRSVRPDLEHVAVAGAAHLAPLEQPDAVAEALAGLLQRAAT